MYCFKKCRKAYILLYLQYILLQTLSGVDALLGIKSKCCFVSSNLDKSICVPVANGTDSCSYFSLLLLKSSIQIFEHYWCVNFEDCLVILRSTLTKQKMRELLLILNVLLLLGRPFLRYHSTFLIRFRFT